VARHENHILKVHFDTLDSSADFSTAWDFLNEKKGALASTLNVFS
jgi:hypothetical protein